jgi:NDP-sugar pyrophosphorylase family protein
MKAVILAGGRGERLRPYTTVLPKPLMPVGERPILEYLIRRLVKFKFDEITISVGYLASLIEAYFSNGEKYGAKIDYLREDKPLGTVGPIKQLQHENVDWLVMNGDVLSDIDFDTFRAFHLHSKADLTIATFKRTSKIDFGVLDVDEDGFLKAYKEKPTDEYVVSMGIYYCRPETLDLIPANSYYDLPTLAMALIKDNKKVACYLHDGTWLDIGRPDDYEFAQDNFGRLMGADKS